MRHENPDQWTESDWLQRLGYRACRLTHCTDDAADLAHACLYAFYDHFHRFPWQHPDPPRAWRWCCQKLRSLWLDEKRHAQRYPQLSLDEMPEGVALVELTAQVHEDADGEAFLAALPKSLREPLQLLLQGYSWEEAARLLGKKSSTLRGYLPELRTRFVAFFGYDPSNRASESLIDMEGKTIPSDESANGGEDDASDGGKEQGFSDDTGSAGGKHPVAWNGVHCDLRWVRILLRGRLKAALMMSLGTACLFPLQPRIGTLTAWSQEGYFTYEIEVRGTGGIRQQFCNIPPLVNTWHVNYRGSVPAYSWGTRLSANFGEQSEDSTVKFIIYWHGTQAPEPFVALSYFEWAFLNVTTPRYGGSATSSFSGNILSESVSLQGACDPPDYNVPCHRSEQIADQEIHPYWVNFTQVREGLWKAELNVPFRVKASIQGACPPPPLGSSSGYIEGLASVGISEPKFVYIVAENEPSYHKKDDCVAVMNNTSGRLDDRYGDTVIELYASRQYIPSEYGGGYFYTDWYLGNRLRYTRMLHGNWCPGDCPLNEWWICGAYYKDNLFHEFTAVDAVIGFPKSDCEDWYIGSESGWNDEPGVEFWQREEVQRRVAAILDKLPFEYKVKLKVTDDEGNGFSDRADYTMTVHAPLELTKLVKIYDTFLPEEGRSAPHEFIPSEAYGAVRLSEWLNNYGAAPLTRSVTIEREDSFSSSFSGSIECSLSGEHNIPLLGKKLIGAKFGIGRTISTSHRYRIGMSISLTVSPGRRGALFSQRAATIEEWLADSYGWNGYQGTGRLKLWRDIRFEYVYWEERITR